MPEEQLHLWISPKTRRRLPSLTPTPDGKLFATHYCGTSQFLVYNFVSGTQSARPSPDVM
uniref:N-acetyltransferase ESCO acetyl-transferase domain-containing protein n=1 Tax=Anguilla anguilla TaxID=7936 RepID=A0A0E9PKP4_ANGAN